VNLVFFGAGTVEVEIRGSPARITSLLPAVRIIEEASRILGQLRSRP
jgi:hypothetical protein